MKKTLTLLLMAALAFTGCKKEITGIENSAEHYALNEFIDSRAIDNDASRSNTISPRSNLKAIIRQVANSTDKYRLILKVDSIEMEVKDPKTGEIVLAMVDIESLKDVKVTAGLSIPDLINPDKETVLFAEGGMTFTKQNENGFFVYASAPFGGPSGTTDEPNGFAYDMVDISYNISHFGTDIFAPGHVRDRHRCFILPNGKAIAQNPEVERVNAGGKWTHSSGQVFVETMVITIANDPAQEIEKITFVPGLIKDTKYPFDMIQMPSLDFEKTVSNPNTGIAKFVNKAKASTVYREYSWSGFTPLSATGVFYSVSGKGGKVTKIVVSSGGLDY